MKYQLILALLLTACSRDVIIPPWPDAPESISVACPPLTEVRSPDGKLSEVITVVTDNYALYHECQTKLDSWIEWYHAQKEIYSSIK